MHPCVGAPSASSHWTDVVMEQRLHNNSFVWSAPSVPDSCNVLQPSCSTHPDLVGQNLLSSSTVERRGLCMSDLLSYCCVSSSRDVPLTRITGSSVFAVDYVMSSLKDLGDAYRHLITGQKSRSAVTTLPTWALQSGGEWQSSTSLATPFLWHTLCRRPLPGVVAPFHQLHVGACVRERECVSVCVCGGVGDSVSVCGLEEDHYYISPARCG
jgi:hypothetical protein